MLNLKNCRYYELNIYPEKFPWQIAKENKSSWHDGVQITFDYKPEHGIYGPNILKSEDAINLDLVNATYLTLSSTQPLTCQNLELYLIQKPYLYKNHSHLETVIQKVPSFTLGQTIDISNFQPCMSHRLELRLESNKSAVPIYEHNFRTLKSELSTPLGKHEVIVWNPEDKSDYDVVTIEWADRCMEKYRLDICQFPYNCSADTEESFSYRTFDVEIGQKIEEKSPNYPKQTVTDLLPCAFYSFDIWKDDESFLFFNGSFVTPFSDEDFDLNLHNLQVSDLFF